MNRTIKAYIDELTVDSKCPLNEMLADFYRTAGHHTSFNGITEQEKVVLRKLVEELDMHDSFTTPFLENFNADLTPIGLFEAVKGISSIANAVDVRVGLEKLYRHPEASISIKDYVKVWLMQPLQVLDKLNEFLEQMMFDDEHIFTTAMNDSQLFNKAVKKAIVHPEDFNLLSFVVFNENSIPARVYSLTEEVLSVDIAGASTIKDIHERIGTIKMEDVKGTETGLSGLRNATECLLKIHQAYPIMQANMINYSTRSINSSMTGGVKLSASQVVNLYAGDYSSYATAQDDGDDGADMADFSSVRGLIINPDAFNALPSAGRNLVAQHLPATRKQFNQIVVNAINSVHTWMPQLLNAHTDNRELNRVIDGLSKSYNSITGNQQGMVDWFMHKFAPAVNAYRSRAMPSTGIAVVDNVFSGSPVKSSTHIYGSGMNGGAKRTYINHDEDTSGMRLFGGGPIADYFEGVKRAQLKFNEQFDSIYRKLTAAVRMVADKGQFTVEQGIERVVEALMSITIASKKTVMKLSGLTPRKDLNARYTSMVEHVIKTIENTKISGFNEVINTLRSLISALRAVKQEATQLIKRVSEATKSSEEIVKYMSVEREEMPSKLSANELHALVEAINALTFATRGNQLAPKIERHREEDLKEYVKKVTDRATAINHYYDNLLDTYIKWNRNVTADTRNLVRAHVKSVQSAMLYLNEKVDTKLIEWRRKMANGGNLTKKQIEDIERLTMTYMHYRPGEKILQIFGKLEKLRKDITDKLSISDLFKITGVVHKIVMNAGYIELIQQLYRTLEIDDGTFDWNVFKINVTKLLVDKLIAIDDHRMTLKVNSKGTLKDGMIAIGDEADKLTAHSTQIHYSLAKRIHTALATKLTDLGYNQLFNLCVAAFTPLAPETGFSAINSAVNMTVEGAILCTGYANRKMDKITRTPGDDKGEERLIPVSSYDIHKKTFDDEEAVKAIFTRISLTPIADIVNKQNAWADRDKETAKGQALRFILAAADHVTQILERHKVHDIYSAETIIKFADELCKLFIETSSEDDDTKVVAMHKGTAIITAAQDELNLTWDGYYNTSHETTTIVDIFHSMIANVLYVFNRYIGLRYTGSDSSLPIPIMSSAMLGGGLEEFGAGSAAEGSKMEAGSAIDIIGVHDLKFDRVIPEAVPFYAIALDIFSTFMKERWNVYNDKTHKTGVHNDEEYGDNKFNMYVTISEFSLLHQLHEILKDYTIDSDVHRKRAAGNDDGSYNFKNLSQTQLKMIIAELNKIWNLVNGSGKDKLMNAIDYIIGEINASILYTTKSRYEQLKRDGGGDFDITSKVAQQFDGVLSELEQVISDNISLVTTLRPDAMVEFESFLTNSVERVKRETNEVSRLNYVLTIINDDENVYKTPFEDYYKFCEFVITPIMITATSYKEAFELFSRIKTNVVNGEDSSIDLKDYSVALYKNASSVFVDEDLKDVLGADATIVPVTEICETINDHNPDAKILAAAASLVNSAVVSRYNGILIKRAINTAMTSNRSFVMPNVWLPLVPSTYPKKEAYKISTNYAGSKDAMSKMQLSSASISMHELFPQIKSDKISDFFNAILQEFSADFDHLLHSFMTYPGISDRFLMQLKDVHENSITSLKHLINKGLWDGNDYLPADMIDKKLTKVSEAFVPPYPEDLNMQPYMGTATVPAISLQRYGDVTTDVYTMLSTGQKVYSISIASDRSKISTAGMHSCHYGPLDWVIYKLAACNTTGYTLPVMLYEMLKNNSLFGRFLVECVVDGSRVMYTPHSNGYVNNIVTQNILTRSSTERNRQESADMKTINKPWIANLVSTIPGLISYLKALGAQTDGSVKDYNGISVEQIYVTLTTILESFYEECVTYMPFVPFMSDFIPGTFYASIERKMSKYHPIAEIYGAMTDDNCDCDGLKFEWANRAYYSGTMQIPFPEYKNRDKYENLKKWGGNLFQNSLFAQEFEGTMDIIARSIIRHRIIKRNSTTQLVSKQPIPPADTNINPEVVDICYNAIRKCYELDPTILELFITNIIRLARGSAGAMLGGWTSYASAATTTSINGTASSIVSRLLTGIFANLNGLTASETFNESSTDISTMVNAAISLLYDNPNMRPFYGFVDENARKAYKSEDNLIRGDLNIRGSMKLAAENVTPDATTRAQQLLAYSVVNEKGRTALNDDTPAYNYTGTIGTAARYAFKNAGVSPNLGRFREKLRDATYDSASMVEMLNAGAGDNLSNSQGDRTPQQNTISKLIEGYANMDRLLIATNAMATMVDSVFDGLNINATEFNATDRGYLADIFNWLSLSDNDNIQYMRYIKNDTGAPNPLLPVTWNNAHGNPDDAASTRTAITGKRWDDAADNCTLGLKHVVDGKDGAVLDNAARTTIGQLLKALMLVTRSGMSTIDDVLKFVGVGASAAINNGDQITGAANNGAGIIGKALNTDIDGNAIFSILINSTAPTDAGGDRTVHTSTIASLLRTITLYILFTRFNTVSAARIRADVANAGLISQWCKWFGITLEAGTSETTIQTILKFIATVIEIGMRAPAGQTSNMVSMVAALGPKLNDYLNALRNGGAFKIPAPGDDATIVNPTNYAAKVINSGRIGRTALAIFDAFHCGGSAAKMAAMKAGIDGAVGANMNANIWTSVIGRRNGIAYNATDVAERGYVANAAVSTCFASYSIVPIEYTNGSVTVMEMNKSNIFGKEYEHENGDITQISYGFGATKDILDALSIAEDTVDFTSATAANRSGLDGLIDAIYGSAGGSVLEHAPGFMDSTVNGFVRVLKDMGFLSLVMSPSYSFVGVKLNGGTMEYNMLGSSFYPGNADVAGNLWSLYSDPVIAQLPISVGAQDAAIYATFADLAITSLFERVPVSAAASYYARMNPAKLLIKAATAKAIHNAAKRVVTMCDAGYMAYFKYDAYKGAVGYPTNIPTAVPIGIEDHPENHIFISGLPTIIPSIRAINSLTTTSVRLYQHLPRMIGEYMIWNPGYELSNLPVAEIVADDLINIPFNVVINPAASYTLAGGDWKKDDEKRLIITNTPLRSFAMTPGLFDPSIASGVAPTWYNILASAPYGAGINYKAVIYTTSDPALNPLVRNSSFKTEVIGSQVVDTLISIIDKWCNSFSEKANTMPKDNGWSLNMLGGSLEFDKYISRDNIAAGEPYKIYPHIYPTSDGVPGLTFYGKLFKTITRTTKSIGSLALAYFNRSLLTFSGILSNLVYPNAIYGKSLFNHFADALGKAVGDIDQNVYGDKFISNSTDKEAIKNRWQFYVQYISHFSEKLNDTVKVTASERALYALNQCCIDNTKKTAKDGIRKFNEMTINGFVNRMVGKGNDQSRLCSEFTAPSICNSFMTILHNLILGKTNDNKDNVDPALSRMEWFMGTETMGTLRSVDVLLTYTSVVASLIKQLSFFDMDENMERPYIPRDPAEPYMGIKPEQF